MIRNSHLGTSSKRKFASDNFELSVGGASTVHRQDFCLDHTVPSRLSIKAKDVDLMIVTDNGNGESTIALCLYRTGEDKIDKEEKRRSVLISRHMRIRPQQNQGINVSNERNGG